MSFVHDAIAKASDWLEGWFVSVSTLDCESYEPFQQIDFIGGPFDGLSRDVTASLVWNLPPVVEIPVSRSQYDILDGLEPDESEPPTSLAAYHLDFDGPRWFYRFERQDVIQPARR